MLHGSTALDLEGIDLVAPPQSERRVGNRAVTHRSPGPYGLS